MKKGISKREFARREDCDEKLVRRKIQEGALTTYDDDSLDPALVGTGWRKRNEDAIAEAEFLEQDDEALEASALRIFGSSSFEMLSKADAELKKANLVAKLHELKYDIEAGKVVFVKDVMEEIVPQLANVRSKLLELPSTLPAKLLKRKTAAEMQAVLQEAIKFVLDEISEETIARINQRS